MYTEAKYQNGMDGNAYLVRIDINGVTSFVPIDPANVDYAAIMALVAAGELTIAPGSP